MLTSHVDLENVRGEQISESNFIGIVFGTDRVIEIQSLSPS